MSDPERKRRKREKERAWLARQKEDPVALKRLRDQKLAHFKKRWKDPEFRAGCIERSRSYNRRVSEDPTLREERRKRREEYYRNYSKLPHRKASLKHYRYIRRSKARTPKWADTEAIKEFIAACPEGFHNDHIVPLNGDNVCGLNLLCNLQHLPAAKNLSKKNKLLPDYESGEVFCLIEKP